MTIILVTKDINIPKALTNNPIRFNAFSLIKIVEKYNNNIILIK